MYPTTHTFSLPPLQPLQPLHAPWPVPRLGAVANTPDEVLLRHLQHSVMQVVGQALERARHGGQPPWPGPAAAPAVTAAPRGAALARLSVRERQVLQHIAAGDSNKRIARALGLSVHTVKRHVANILDKLGAQSRGQAAACSHTGA